MNREYFKQELSNNSNQNILTRAPWNRAEFNKSDNFSYIVTDINNPLFNIIFDPASDIKEAFPSVPDSLYKLASEKNVPLMFWPAAVTLPGEYEKIFNLKGFKKASEPEGMVLLKKDFKPIPEQENFTVKQVENREQLKEWSRITTHLYHFNPADEAFWIEMVESAGYYGAKKWRHYTGFIDKKPVASASIFKGENSITLANIAVDPAYRKQGFGTAICNYALLNNPYEWDLCTLWATESGQSVYKSIGFKKICRSSIYICNP